MTKTLYVVVRHDEDAGMRLRAFEYDTDRESFIAVMKVSGHEHKGYLERHDGGFGPRDELIGHPRFKGLCGPMWGGFVGPDGNYDHSEPPAPESRPSIRYEDWKAHERLSA